MIREEIIIRISELETELINHNCNYEANLNSKENHSCKICDDFEKSCDKLLDMWVDLKGYWKECQHVDYTETLDGAVCNDCNLEVGGEE